MQSMFRFFHFSGAMLWKRGVRLTDRISREEFMAQALTGLSATASLFQKFGPHPINLGSVQAGATVCGDRDRKVIPVRATKFMPAWAGIAAHDSCCQPQGKPVPNTSESAVTGQADGSANRLRHAGILILPGGRAEERGIS